MYDRIIEPSKYSLVLSFCKAKALPEGTVRQWGGRKYKKIGNMWVSVSDGKDVSSRVLKRAELHFESAIASGLPGVAIIDMLEKVYKIKGFKDLRKYVQTHTREESVSLYKNLWSYVSKMGLPKSRVRYAFDNLVKTMILLQDFHGIPKKKLMVKIKDNGKTRYKYKTPDAPVASARQLRSAREKLAGWSDMSNLPTPGQIKQMIKNKNARLIFGKINSRKKWIVVESRTIIPFREGEKGVTVKLKQIRKLEKRTRRTAELDIKIPYAYARQFLDRQIGTARRRNDLIDQLNNSAGYRRYFKISRVA